MGTRRYKRWFYELNGFEMVELARGSKFEMHMWQHNKILEYMEIYGCRPPWNKSLW